jgi:hypothetical protein
MPASPSLLEGYSPEPDIAKDIGCSYRTLIRRRLRGEAPPHIKLHDRIWYRREAVAEWLLSLERQTSRGRRTRERAG